MWPTKRLTYSHMNSAIHSQGDKRSKSPSKKTLSTLNLSASLLHYVPRLRSSELCKDEIPSLIQPPMRKELKRNSATVVEENRDSPQLKRNPISTASKSIQSSLDKWHQAYKKAYERGSITELINNQSILSKSSST